VDLPEDADVILNGVTAPSSSLAWAVGAHEVSRKYHPVIEQWNGSSWSLQTSPNVGFGELQSVVATSSSNAWAVGWRSASAFGCPHPLIERWNGTTWKVV
jgi:hypothetical protein